MKVEEGRVPVAPGPDHKSDLTAGNDKTLTVPAGKVWQVLWGYTQFTTSSSAGNREVRLEITDTDGPLWKVQAVDQQGASSVEDYHFSASVDEPIATKPGQQYLPMPNMCLMKPGDVIRVHDVNDVDAVGDVLAVEFVVQEFEE